MGLYKIKAATPEGRLVFREIEAASKEEIAPRLEREGLYPLEVRSKGFSLNASLFSGKEKVKSGDFLIFNQGLSTLLKAGLPLIDSLETLGETSRSPILAGAIKDSLKSIKSGQSISESFAKHPKVFPELYIATIAAGERTGDLIPSIRGYMEYQKRIEAIRKKVVSSATYPTVLLIASVGVVGFLLAYVVPSFAKIYLDSSAELPLPTKVLIGATSFIKEYLFLVAVLFIGAGIGLRAYLGTGNGRQLTDRLKLSFPHLGEIYLGYATAKFTRTLGMVLKSGLPLVDALKMSKAVLDNRVLEKKLDYVIKRAVEGGTVTEAIEKAGLMPEVALRMFGVGERSASLPPILEDIAAYLDEEVRHKVEIITDLIEPALMVIMGIIIGTIVVLMYLPIFQLGARV